MPSPPKLLKGALIEFSSRFIGATPNVILFQYNPETMTRTLKPWYSGESDNGKSGPESATAQPEDPPEEISLTLELNAADYLESPHFHPVAAVSGVADRLAALEMLLYPQQDISGMGLLGSVAAGLGGATLSGGVGAVAGGLAGGAAGAAGVLGEGLLEDGLTRLTTVAPVPRGAVPDVLFAWGPGRIVPVRLTSFSVEEQAFSPTLYPIRAKVTVGLKILAPRNLPCGETEGSRLAITAYKMYIRQKRGLAAGSVAGNAHSLKDMLPFT